MFFAGKRFFAHFRTISPSFRNRRSAARSRWCGHAFLWPIGHLELMGQSYTGSGPWSLEHCAVEVFFCCFCATVRKKLWPLDPLKSRGPFHTGNKISVSERDKRLETKKIETFRQNGLVGNSDATAASCRAVHALQPPRRARTPTTAPCTGLRARRGSTGLQQTMLHHDHPRVRA